MARRKITWRAPRFEVTGDYETCTDCSERDAVSFTFGHLSRRAMEDPTSTRDGRGRGIIREEREGHESDARVRDMRR